MNRAPDSSETLGTRPIQAETFAELESTVMTDVANLTKYCQQQRLKPSTYNTVTP